MAEPIKVTAQISTKVTDEEARWLAEMARDSGVTPAQALREIFRAAQRAIRPVWRRGPALNQFLRGLRLEPQQ